MEALPNRRVAPDGRNPTYGSLMVLYYARERIADFIHRKDAKDAEIGQGSYCKIRSLRVFALFAPLR